MCTEHAARLLNRVPLFVPGVKIYYGKTLRICNARQRDRLAKPMRSPMGWPGRSRPDLGLETVHRYEQGARAFSTERPRFRQVNAPCLTNAQYGKVMGGNAARLLKLSQDH